MRKTGNEKLVNPNESADFGNADLKNIFLAGGCFWGIEAYFKRIFGVYKTAVGYANGKTANPTYHDIKTSGHTETVMVKYDAKKVSLKTLLNHFFRIVDPTTLNRQGPDRGTQYRSGIYYENDGDLAAISEVLESIRLKYPEPVVTEVMKLLNFYPAEEYHQDYLEKNPGGYCHIDLSILNAPPEVDPSKYAVPGDWEIKAGLSEEQYLVTRKNHTEPPFRNAYWDKFERGLYVDIVSGEPLFASKDKFESGCGWPSFSKPINEKVISEKEDRSFGKNRTETRSRVSDSHLGHVFIDGPSELGGLRYCINSASLRFVPVSEMEKEGYGEYIPYV